MLCREQLGFLPRRSTVSNLIMCDSLISNLLNEGNACNVILLDFMQAFDKVPHNIVLQKLTRLGIAEQPLKWIANFLSARSQVVSYNGALFEAIPASSGIIQGSAIGPLLFVAFIYNLPSLVSNCDLIFFADDSKAVGKYNNRDEHALIQKDLNAISNWSAENHLPFNIEKCACLQYGCKNCPISSTAPLSNARIQIAYRRYLPQRIQALCYDRSSGYFQQGTKPSCASYSSSIFGHS